MSAPGLELSVAIADDIFQVPHASPSTWHTKGQGRSAGQGRHGVIPCACIFKLQAQPTSVNTEIPAAFDFYSIAFYS